MAKTKKKAKQDKGAKKGKKGKSGAAGLPKTAKAAARKIQDWSRNPLVADIVAAALVATAAALKDTKTARRLAAEGGDELEKLTKKGAERGNAMWQMALDIGRRSLEQLSDAGSPSGKAPAKPAKVPNRNSRSKGGG